MKYHCVTFDLGSTRIFSTAKFETYFTYHKTIQMGEMGYYVLLHSCVILLIDILS